jgi:hypothetical protein
MISAVCPHVAIFGSAPSYEHLRVFGCACYPNIAAIASHKLAPRSTRCVFLGYSADHKGYHCLDLSINHLIVSRHVVFDEDNFPLTASPSLTDLDFLCKSGPTVSTIGTHLTTAGTSSPTPSLIPSSSRAALTDPHWRATIGGRVRSPDKQWDLGASFPTSGLQCCHRQVGLHA